MYSNIQSYPPLSIFGGGVSFSLAKQNSSSSAGDSRVWRRAGSEYEGKVFGLKVLI
jgi:hypothetical protein